MNDRSVPGPAPTSVRPTIVLKAGEHKRVLTGHPWIYSNEVVMDAAAKTLAAGTLVRIVSHDGRAVGAAMFSPRPLIAARLFSRDPAATIDRDFLAARLARALALRNKLFSAPYYRLVHAEADGLPGTVIDRFGDTAVVQINTAGMELLQPALLAALDDVVAPSTVILRNDGPMRALEGLDSYVRCSRGSVEGPIELVENGVRFLADPREGQKTGWFFDQRDNRAAVAGLAAGGGAAAVVGVDRSEPALELAARAASLKGVAARCRFQRGDAFATLEGLHGQGERFGVVVADPPAFVKSKKEINQAARAYRKLARLAAAVVEPGGFLFIASCSHHMTAENFAEQVSRGLGDAGRGGRILRGSGAAADHPVHPALPETAYLKGLLLQVD